jgi:hypothetical protein
MPGDCPWLALWFAEADEVLALGMLGMDEELLL